MVAKPTLEEYQLAERTAAREEARRGFRVHAVVTAVVSITLIMLNVTVASGFPWSVFAVAGMAIGLFVHWLFGVVKRDEIMERHQQTIEQRAVTS